MCLPDGSCRKFYLQFDINQELHFIFHNCFHCLTVSSFQLQDVQMTMDNLETVGNKDLVALDSFVRPLDYVQVC